MKYGTIVWGVFWTLFILKVTSNIDASWWLVFAPLWVPLVLFTLAGVVGILVGAVIETIVLIKEHFNRKV